MSNGSDNKPVYDLEERTFLFAKKVRKLVKKMKLNHYNQDDIRQIVKASGSVGANYIEANEALSKKDFYHRIKICRKESKETAYWSRLLLETNKSSSNQDLSEIYNKAIELKKIFSAIIAKSNQ